MKIGLLIIRWALGGGMFLRGGAKLTRHGRRGTAQYFAGMFAVGFATPLAAAGLIAVLVSAIAVKSGNGYWNTGDGYEYPLLAAGVAAAAAFTGPGEVSVDAILGWTNVSTAAGISAVVAGIAASAPLLLRRATILRTRPVAAGLHAETI